MESIQNYQIRLDWLIQNYGEEFYLKMNLLLRKLLMKWVLTFTNCLHQLLQIVSMKMLWISLKSQN